MTLFLSRFQGARLSQISHVNQYKSCKQDNSPKLTVDWHTHVIKCCISKAQ